MDRTKRSRSGSWGWAGSTRMVWKYSTVSRSMADSEPPMWPELAVCTMSTARSLALAARTSSSRMRDCSNRITLSCRSWVKMQCY